MRFAIILKFLIFVLIVLPFSGRTDSFQVKEVSFLTIKSAITPATFDYLRHQFHHLPDDSLVVIKMNTPGGLVSTTKDIISLIGAQKRPVAIWISPQGAGAASAGAIIASSAHFILMAPGTNIGAATPVGFGEDIPKDGKQKALNDLMSLVRSMSQLRGRPAAPFENMIKTAASYTDKEAFSLKIIDAIVSNEKDIEKVLHGKTFLLNDNEHTLLFENPILKEYEPTLGQKILEVIANPSTAYILFLIGVALIYFEFQAPGGFIAGAVGTCLVLLAGIAFQVLPLNWGAMALIATGIILLILEVFVVSYGVLSIAGMSSFIIGTLFLFHDEEGFISVDYTFLISIVSAVFITGGLLVWKLYQDEKKQKYPKDFFGPIGSKGHVLSLTPLQIKVRGEIWKVSSEETLQIGDEVEVFKIDEKQLLAFVRKI